MLIRHGEAQSAVDRVVGGHKGCTGLSELGRRQAAALAERLARTGELSGASAFYTSVLPRAVETAEAIAPAIGALDLQQTCELCEVHTGEQVDGMPWDELEELIGATERSPYTPWAPGTESFAEFSIRIGRALEQIVRDHAGHTIVVACHGGVVEASFLCYAEMPLRRRFRLQVDNTSVTEWERRPYPEGQRWTLVRFNDTAHLADLG